MKINIKSGLFLGIFVLMISSSCKKENVSLQNKFPEIPVTVPNKIGTYVAPTVSSSFGGGGAIKIVLEIPASSGKTIKEITRVAASTSVKSVQGTTGLYNTAPIPGTGTTATFNTTLAEYYAKAGGTPITAVTAGTATSFLANSFYFMIALSDGQVIIPTQVRVYVDK